jgi:acyl dehydratase
MTPMPAFSKGTALPELTIGPLTHLDLVRWAGYQENWLRIHYDREHAGRALGARDAVQSGHHRTALIVRAITDWLGDAGWVRGLSIRHASPVFPGDTLTCGGRVRDVRADADGRRTLDLEVWARVDASKMASEGTAVVEVTSNEASRDADAAGQ